MRASKSANDALKAITSIKDPVLFAALHDRVMRELGRMADLFNSLGAAHEGRIKDE